MKGVYFCVFNVLYPVFSKLIGRKTYEMYEERSKSQYYDWEDIESIQFRKLKTVLENAYKNVPYYRERFDSIGLNPCKLKSMQDFSNVDFFISKDDVRSEVDKFFALGTDKKKLSWHRTGGSTGTPLYFATDLETDSGSAAAFMKSLSWFGIPFGSKHAIFWGSPSYVVRTKKDRFIRFFNWVRDFLMNRMFISNYDLNDRNMYKVYKRLERFRPVYIRGMASSLYMFSKFMASNNLVFYKCRPVMVHSACEQLFEWQRDVIEKAFACEVVNTYGLSEVADIAYSARCGSLHVMDEDVLVELVPHSSGGKEIVVTQLNNLQCPLIRYKTGDIAESLGACDCKDCLINLRVLKGLQGRAHDILYGEKGQAVHGQFFTHLIVYEAGVEKFQVIQSSLTKIEVRLVVSAAYDREATETVLVKLVKRNMGEGVVVDFSYHEAIPLTPAGKHRWIISRLKEGAA